MVKNVTASPSLGQKIKKVLINYLLTQLVLMIIVSLAIFGILTLLNVKYAVLLAILTGVLSVIPNYGMIVSSFIVALVAIFDNAVFLPNLPPFVEGLAVILILVILNKLSDTFLAPILLSKQNKINPLLIFFTVILGTLFFGVIGAVLAVPILLVIKTVLDHYNIKK